MRAFVGSLAAALCLMLLTACSGGSVSADGDGIKINPPSITGAPEALAQADFLSDLAVMGFPNAKLIANASPKAQQATAGIGDGIVATFERSNNENDSKTVRGKKIEAFHVIKIIKRNRSLDLKGLPGSPDALGLQGWLLLNGHR